VEVQSFMLVEDVAPASLERNNYHLLLWRELEEIQDAEAFYKLGRCFSETEATNLGKVVLCTERTSAVCQPSKFPGFTLPITTQNQKSQKNQRIPRRMAIQS
jgi:hypothetical protein